MIFLTVPQAAERLQCSEGCVRDMISAGKLAAVRLGKTANGDVRIAEAALWELGVGGPRPIVIGVSTASETVATPDTSGCAPVRSRATLRGGKAHA
jgi:excisionase family DNA binding protein